MSGKVAVVTGSNSGLGFAIVKRLCRKFKGVVYLTSINIKLGVKAITKLNKLGFHPEFLQLDITDRESITNFRDHILKKHGGIDIMINNAGIISRYLKIPSYEEEKHIIDTNYRSMLIIEELIFPIIKQNGRILNISSSSGHLSNVKNTYWTNRLSKEELKVKDINTFVDWYLESSKNGKFDAQNFADNGSFTAYKVSKVALSALTRIHQKLLEFKNISVNSMHPGIMKTGMTFGIGALTPDEAAVTPVHLVLDAPQSLKGEFVWCDGRVIDWCDCSLDVVYYSHILSKHCNLLFYSFYTTAKKILQKCFQLTII